MFKTSRPTQADGVDYGALQGVLGIVNLTSRSELKGELLKELERHASFLNTLREKPGVDSGALDAILADLGNVLEQLHGLDNQTINRVQRNDFLVAVRQRVVLPGGVCAFDLPALHHWLQQDCAVRATHMRQWLAPFEPMRLAVDLILQLIRGSAIASEEIATQGMFQKILDSGSPNQLVRVMLPAGGTVFPEISASRHRFSIRFMEQPDPHLRARHSSDNISFWLACCAI